MPCDADGDGLFDIVLNSILGDVIWLKDVGARTRPTVADAKPVEVEWDMPQPWLDWGWRRPKGSALLTQWRTIPVVYCLASVGTGVFLLGR